MAFFFLKGLDLFVSSVDRHIVLFSLNSQIVPFFVAILN